jgi:hypothetical protein
MLSYYIVKNNLVDLKSKALLIKIRIYTKCLYFLFNIPTFAVSSLVYRVVGDFLTESYHSDRTQV